MGRHHDALAALHAIAAAHHGVVTRDDVLGVGLTPGALRAAIQRGSFRRAHRGVFVSTAAPESWRQQAMIAVRIGGGVASHRCAARLHQCDGFSEAPVEVLVARNGPREIEGAIVHRTSRLDSIQTLLVDGIPTTSIAETLVDLGAVVEDDDVEKALDDMLRRGYNLRWMNQTLAAAVRPGPTGVGALQRVLARPDRRGPLPDSTFERLLERVVADARLPAPERQFVVGDERGTFARIDAAWPEQRVGLEADSELWHWGPRRGRIARKRHNRLTAAGWNMFYASWQDVDDPSDLIEQLRSALGLD